MAAPLNEAWLRAQVAAVRSKFPKERFIGIHAPGGFAGPRRLETPRGEVEVIPCASELAMRELMAARTEEGDGALPLVLLSALPQQDLSNDVLARLAKGELLQIHPWRVVMELFQARGVDPSLLRIGAMAELLIDVSDRQGFDAAPSGVLDAETAWSVVLRHRLGMRSGQPDLVDLLRWTRSERGPAAFDECAPEIRAGLAEWLAGRVGPAARAVLDCVRAGRGRDAIALGLVFRVVFSDKAQEEPALIAAAVRIETFLGGERIAVSAALDWAAAAESLAREGMPDVQDRAAAILREVRAEEFAYRSALLRLGLEQRIERLAKVLRGVAERADRDRPVRPKDLEVALDAVREHVLLDGAPGRRSVVEMGARLARRLPSGGSVKPGSLEDAARAYEREGAFVDWARDVVWPGDTSVPLQEALRAVHRRVSEERAGENRTFATLLADWSTTGSSSQAVIGIERVLSEVVAPIARRAPVALFVLDGMSFAVFQELIEDIARAGWVEWAIDGTAQRKLVIAALPTETERSRASLFAGALVTGDRAEESRRFASHPELLGGSRPARPPALFHKADLTEKGGGLGRELREALESDDRRVVAVVVNAVDDYLAKGEQHAIRWGLGTIRPLAQLLDAARAGERVVVLTSDHGHVLDRDSQYRASVDGGQRWRPAQGTPEDGEILLEGPRVLTATNRIFAPFSEQLRYKTKQTGYHGGATPQEVLVPLAVLAPLGKPIPVEGAVECSMRRPEWWERTLPTQAAPAAAPERAAIIAAAVPVAPPARQPDLFAARPAPAPPPTPAPRPRPAWLDRLIASPIYREQQRRVERLGLSEARVREAMIAIDGHGGKLTKAALARALNLPPVRLTGILAALRRLLNVEGYAILDVDDEAETIELNRPLLEKQFDLQ